VTAPRRMLLNAFHMNCVSHIQQGLWVRDDTRQLDYTQLDPWVELAQILEKGCFDALFLADVMGLYDKYLTKDNFILFSVILEYIFYVVYQMRPAFIGI
jgi:long-chain alkane monooxygenase